MLTLIAIFLALSLYCSLPIKQLVLPNLTFYQLHFHSKCSLFCCFTWYLNIFIIARILPELRVFSHKVPAATAAAFASAPLPLLPLHPLVSLSTSHLSFIGAMKRSVETVDGWQKTESCGKINIAQNFSPPTHLQLLRTYTTRTVPQPPGPAFCFGLALMMYALWKELSKVVFRVWWANVDPGNISSHLSLSRDVSFYHSPCLSTSALRCVFAFRWLHNKVINGLQWGFNYAISAIWIWMIFWLFALASCWALLSERLVSYRKLKQRENGKTK